MLTEYKQAKEDDDRPKLVWLPTLSFCLAPDGSYTAYVTP